MTEVWKSQAKKFCKLCKCWFADNKVSVQFHENGNRHKAAVQEKLRELGRKGIQQEKEKRDLNYTLLQMEMGAIKSHKKDMKNDDDKLKAAMPSAMGARRGSRVVRPAYTGPVLPSHSSKPYDSRYTAGSMPLPTPSVTESESKEWAVAISPEGHTYYWNVNTGDTNWDPPSEGYLTQEEQEMLERQQFEAEQEQQAGEEEKTQSNAYNTDRVPKSIDTKCDSTGTGFTSGFVGKYETFAIEPKVIEQQFEQTTDSYISHTWTATNTDIAEGQVDDNISQPLNSNDVGISEVKLPNSDTQSTNPPKQKKRTNPFGEWTSVPESEVPKKLPDLGLPKLEKPDTSHEQYLIDASEQEERKRIKFKEKTVSSMVSSKIGLKTNSSGPATFKKRRGPAGRSLRTREDDE